MLIRFRVALQDVVRDLLNLLLISRGGFGFTRRINSDISRLIASSASVWLLAPKTTTANILSGHAMSFEISLIEVDIMCVEMWCVTDINFLDISRRSISNATAHPALICLAPTEINVSEHQLKAHLTLSE